MEGHFESYRDCHWWMEGHDAAGDDQRIATMAKWPFTHTASTFAVYLMRASNAMICGPCQRDLREVTELLGPLEISMLTGGDQ